MSKLTTGSLVTILERTSPSLLDSLKSKYPDAADLFSNDFEMGPEGATADTNVDKAALFDLAKAGLGVVRQRVEALLNHVLARMTLASRIRLLGAIAASASGLASAYLTLSQNRSAADIVTASLSFLGGLVTIVADQVIRSPSGMPVASNEEHAKILEIRLEIERSWLRLDREPVIPLSREDLISIVNRLDDLSIQLIRYSGS